MSLEDQILRKINNSEKELISYAQKLVQFPTTSGNEKEAQEYVKNVLDELGFHEIDFWEPNIEEMKNHKAFISQRENFKGSPNVVGTLKGTGEGKSIILNSHIDIVPEGQLHEWSYSPFKGEIIDGKLFGRGTSDMKVTKAAFFLVLKTFSELGIKLKGDVILQSVIEEESGGAGTLACTLRGYKADAAIIPEPSNFNIFPSQSGSTWFRVNLNGLSAHGGRRYEGVSALSKVPYIISTIKELEDYRNKIFAHSFFKGNPIPFCINIGTITGGNWPSSVPEKVSLEGRMGIPPQEELEDGWKMFEEWIEKTAEIDSWMKQNKPQVEWFGAFWRSGEIDPNHPIVKVTEKKYKDVMEEKPSLGGAPWGTDGPILTKFANTPALIFGPGSNAHCPDEYVKIKDLLNYSKILALIILDWCGYEIT